MFVYDARYSYPMGHSEFYDIFMHTLHLYLSAWVCFLLIQFML